ncbi:Phage tail tubular protein A [uncultured Mediterranean phage uvMED]|jgi:hypothetical protein|nr:Phage tail tubular protein A [uncultured Mediterranean phage uvMED]|tara:strand:+ start:58 stop:675 length:618 start_codon:yes stop_codon:yes gene_type:complete
MAAGDTQVSIANQSLLLLGADTISNFTNGTAVGNACSIIYPKVKATTLGMYPWSFTLKKEQLSRLSTAPTAHFLYQFSLPPDMLNSVPRTVYASSDRGAAPITDWTIQGQTLLTDREQIFVDYQQDIVEGKLPTYFIQLLVYMLAWNLAETITDQTEKGAYYKQIALGTVAENNRGGYFRTAINLDGAGETPPVIAQYLLTEVRS